MSDFTAKFKFGWGSAPDPTDRAYNAPADPLIGFEGPTSKRREERGQGMRGREGLGEGSWEALW